MKTVILCLALLSSVTFAAEKVLVSGHVEQASELLAGVDYRVTYDDATGKLLLRMMGSMLSSPSPIIYQAMGVLDDAGKAVNGYIGNCGHEPGPDDVLMDLADDGWYQFEINASDYSGNFGMFLVVVIRKDDAANYEAWFGVTNMTVPNDWDNYDWSWDNRIKFSTTVVTSIVVRPKGFPAEATLPDPLTIAVGAIESDAHQADVEIQVTPAEAGLSVSVSLVNGKGTTTAKDAKLVTDSGTATGGGEAKTMLTGTGGKITGTLTSSNVLTTCTIRAGSLERTVTFTWDEYTEEGEWTTDADLLPIPGVVINTLVLRHHRNPKEGSEPWEPLNGHRIRFFVEEAWYVEDGELKADYNTVEQPGDLSGWASFLNMDNDEDNTTNEAGQVTAYLQIEDRQNLVYLWVAAYDLTIWNEAPAATTSMGPQAAQDAADERSRTQGKGHGEGDEKVKLGFVQEWQIVPVTNRPKSSQKQQNAPPVNPVSGGPTEFRVFVYNNTGSQGTAEWSLQSTEPQNGQPPAALRDARVPSQTADGYVTDPKGNFQKVTGTLYAKAFEAYKAGKYVVGFSFTAGGKKHTISSRQVTAVTAQVIGLDTGTFFETQSVAKAKPARYGVLPTTTTTDGEAATDTWSLKAVGGDGEFLFSTDLSPFGDLLKMTLSKDRKQLTVAAAKEGEEAITKSRCYLNGEVQVRIKTAEPIGWAVGDNKLFGWKRPDDIKSFEPATVLKTERLDLPGIIEPLWLLVPDLGIESPNGDPKTPDGANDTNELVFDAEKSKGACKFTMKANPLKDIKPKPAKQLVIDRLVWAKPPDLGPNGKPKCEAKWKPTGGKEDANRNAEALKKTLSLDVVYDTMPSTYEGFGLQTLQLNFTGRQWKWEQEVEFFFFAEGQKAPGANATTPDKIVYWRQIAQELGFDCQSPSFVYHGKNEKGDDKQIGELEFNYGGWPPKVTLDRITIWAGGAHVICDPKGKNGFIETLHHENGHRQSHLSPQIQGGWGNPWTYDRTNDRDRDWYPDTFEATDQARALGFTNNADPGQKMPAWDHADWDAATGRGKCKRNEAEVFARSAEILPLDWSTVGIHKDVKKK